MSAPDLAALRAAAEAAQDAAGADRDVWYEAYAIEGIGVIPADRAFIAAASPAVVLALLDRLERVEEALQSARTTLVVTESCVRVEVHSYGTDRWEGVPEKLRAEVNRIDAALGAPAP